MTFHYPNGKKYAGNPKAENTQAKRINYANRGMTLEEELNITNRYYRESDAAIIHKKPVPVQIVNVDYPKRSAAKITEAYFKKPSTTDYNGIYKGRYIDFEAKETRNKTSLPIQNIHDHQIEHMMKVKKHGGIAFLIVKFSVDQSYYLMDTEPLINAWNDSVNGGRQSIHRSTFEQQGYALSVGFKPRLDYLNVIDRHFLNHQK